MYVAGEGKGEGKGEVGGGRRRGVGRERGGVVIEQQSISSPLFTDWCEHCGVPWSNLHCK